MKMLYRSQGQVWGLDIMIASIIFLTGVIMLYVYLLNFSTEGTDVLADMESQADILAGLILSEGYPQNWYNLSVQEIKVPGIISANEVSQIKLEKFYNLTISEENYSLVKDMLDARYDFCFTIGSLTSIGGSPVECIGKPGVTLASLNEKENLIKAERIVLYQGNITSFELYVWK